jgi:hypothetical protein
MKVFLSRPPPMLPFRLLSLPAIFAFPFEKEERYGGNHEEAHNTASDAPSNRVDIDT